MARTGRFLLAGGGVTALVMVLTGCSSPLSDAKPAAATSATSSGADPGCTAALQDISKYGPSTVKLAAEGRNALSAAGVQLIVDGLDGAAVAANSPQSRQAIQNLANAYNDYFNLSTDVVAIPLSTLLKDTADLEFVCH